MQNLDECENRSQKMRENCRFSEMRRECVNETKMRELHAKCVILGRSASVPELLSRHFQIVLHARAPFSRPFQVVLHALALFFPPFSGCVACTRSLFPTFQNVGAAPAPFSPPFGHAQAYVTTLA